MRPGILKRGGEGGVVSSRTGGDGGLVGRAVQLASWARREEGFGFGSGPGGFVQDVNYCGCPVTCMGGARERADLSAPSEGSGRGGAAVRVGSRSASRPPPILRRRPTCRSALRPSGLSPCRRPPCLAGFSPRLLA